MNARVIQVNGVAQLEINGKVIPSPSFRSFWPGPEITADLYQGGIQLMSIYPSGLLCSLDVPYSQFGEFWLGEGVYDWDVVRRQVNQFITNAPGAYLSLILQLDTRDWFLKAHPECRDSFFHIPEACCYRPWRDAALRCIRDILAFLDAEYPEKLYAVYVCAGGTCEWYNSIPIVEDGPKEAAFKRWTGDTARRLPTKAELQQGEYGNVYGPADKNKVDYWRFLVQQVADTIEEYAAAVKNYNPGLLVGCFSGYTLTHGNRIANSTQLLEHRVAACPNIDIIFSPASYALRGLESVSNSQLPMASIHLNGKVYYHEIDNTPFPANSNPYAQVLQRSAHRRHASIRESIMYARRESARVFAELGTYWWFDMFGGWYNDNELQEALFAVGRAQQRLYSKPIAANAEVVFVADEESNFYIGENNPLHSQCVQSQLEALGRIGCMVDYVVTDDLLLPNFPRDRYKLYIFPDLVAPKPEIRQAVASLRAAGKSMLFLYAPGFIKDGKGEDANMEELTGIRLHRSREKQGYALVPAGEWNDNGTQRIFGGAMNGMTPYIVADENEPACARGLVNRRIQMTVKNRGEGFDAWIAQGPVPEFVLRPLARRAGVRIWQEEGLPLYTNSRMLALHDHQGGVRRVNTAWQCGRLEELYTGETHVIEPGKAVSLTFEPDECKCFIYLKEDE